MSILKSSLPLAALTFSLCAFAQTPPAPAAAVAPAKPVMPRRPPDFPTRPPADAAAMERGKTLYGVHCQFCHGADARGGSGGINLIRNAVVLNDKRGELLLPVLREGREGMPAIPLSPDQAGDIADFLHGFRVGGYDPSRMTPPTILTGDAKAGEAYFQKTCASCHSVTGNLKGIAARITDPKQLQQTWLMPGGGGGRMFGGGPPAPSRVPPTTVTVTLANKQKVTGRLIRIDDFHVTLASADGSQRTYSLENGATAEINDPLIGHRNLLAKYTDKDIHNVTAYLVTIK